MPRGPEGAFHHTTRHNSAPRRGVVLERALRDRRGWDIRLGFTAGDGRAASQLRAWLHDCPTPVPPGVPSQQPILHSRWFPSELQHPQQRRKAMRSRPPPASGKSTRSTSIISTRGLLTLSFGYWKSPLTPPHLTCWSSVLESRQT